jgi:hypothetical protein
VELLNCGTLYLLRPLSFINLFYNRGAGKKEKSQKIEIITGLINLITGTGCNIVGQLLHVPTSWVNDLLTGARGKRNVTI